MRSIDAVVEFEAPVGPIRGHRRGDVVQASGIPYARAERFAAPTPEPDWTEPFDARHPSPASPQPPATLEHVIGEQSGGLTQREHCRHLSVTAPADRADDEQLPVMVWIHGGSYVSGAGDAPIYDPSVLAAEQRVVVVTVTYRLGLLGYLGGGGERMANLGLLDQLEAFRWVQRNIAAFGGDPRRVTAFGQSAGGDAVLHLMATEGARQLFSRAIVQSAPLGVFRGRARMSAAMLAASRDLTAETPIADVVAAQAAVLTAGSTFGMPSLMPFGIQYGHAPLPAEREVRRRWASVAPDIPLLIGTTAQETNLFITAVPALERLAALPLVGGPLAAALSAIMTQLVYEAPARRFVRAYRAAGGRALRYRFTWSARRNRYRSSHAIEVPFVFGTEQLATTLLPYDGADLPELRRVGTAVRTVWADFARGEGLRATPLARKVLKLY